MATTRVASRLEVIRDAKYADKLATQDDVMSLTMRKTRAADGVRLMAPNRAWAFQSKTKLRLDPVIVRRV